MPAAPSPALAVKPETVPFYLCYCPDHVGWHVGEWWADALDVSETLRWVIGRQVETVGSA